MRVCQSQIRQHDPGDDQRHHDQPHHALEPLLGHQARQVMPAPARANDHDPDARPVDPDRRGNDGGRRVAKNGIHVAGPRFDRRARRRPEP